MKHVDYLNLAIKHIDGGQSRVAKELNLKQSSVWKWTRYGLPRTEWTGETNYSELLERLSGGKVTREQLLSSRQ